MSNSNLDYLASQINHKSQTAEEFMISVLPWIEAKTGLKRGTFPLPKIETYFLPFLPIGNGERASGVYSNQNGINRLAIAVDVPMKFAEAVMVHELVHYLQTANPLIWPQDWSGNNPEEFEKNSPKIELLAYQVQEDYYAEILKNSSGVSQDWLRETVMQLQPSLANDFHETSKGLPSLKDEMVKEFSSLEEMLDDLEKNYGPH